MAIRSSPLPDRVRNKVQGRVDTVYNLFTSRVARYRGISENDVIDTEADVYHGEDAATMGLADGIMKFENYLEAVLETESKTRAGSGLSLHSQEELSMSEKDKQTNPAPETQPVVLNTKDVLAQHPQTAADLIQQGADGERLGICAILQHDNVEGRQQLAEHLAFHTGFPVGEAASLLAASPKQVVEVANVPSPFETAMGAIDNPDIGAGDEVTEQSPQTMAAALVEQVRQTGAIR